MADDLEGREGTADEKELQADPKAKDAREHQAASLDAAS